VDEDLVVHAYMRDELSAPIRGIRGEVDHLGRTSTSTARGGLSQLDSGMGRFLGRMKSGGARVLRGAAYGIAAIGTAGVAAGALLVKSAGQTIIEQQRLAAQTGAALKSTGRAAGVTRRDILDLSDALERKSVTDAEVIQSGQNVLLTFTNIRNEVGRGNDIFNRATKSALDMSTALGTDMQGSVTMLGKALNDPTKGITALSRVGVAFTDQQKEQIKTLQESGDSLGAQKIILRELNKEFGGSAVAASKTFEGRWKRVRDTFDGWVESGVKKVMPFAERLVTWLGRRLPSALGVLGGFLAAGVAHVRGWYSSLDRAGVIETVADAIRTVGEFAQNVLFPALGQVVGVLGVLKGPLQGVVDGFGFLAGNGSTTVDVLMAVGAGLVAAKVAMVGLVVAQKAVTAAQILMNLTMRANPIGLVVTAIGVLVGAVVLAYRRSETFRRIVGGAFAVVKVAADKLGDAATWVWERGILPLWEGMKLVGGFFRGAFVGALKLVGNVFLGLFEGVVRAAGFMVNTVLDGFGLLVTGAAKAFGWVPGIGEDLKDADKAFGVFRDGVRDKFDKIADKIGATRAQLNALGEKPTIIDVVYVPDATRLDRVHRQLDRYSAGPVGDTAGRVGRGGFANTMAKHAAYAAGSPGVKVTNILTGGGGRHAGSGDHQAGRALDLTGTGLARYASAVRADGGYAAFHGSGPSRHLHAVPAGDTAAGAPYISSGSRPDAQAQRPFVVNVNVSGAPAMTQREFEERVGRAMGQALERSARRLI
jgi:hypothetical protein